MEKTTRNELPYFVQGAEQYINTVWNKVKVLGIDLTDCRSDHIGVRINWGPDGEGDYSKYLEAKGQLFSAGATLIAEAIIPPNYFGRPIAIFRLPQPIKSEGGEVEYVEIPAPRRNRQEFNGLDHIEIVLPEGISLWSFVSMHYKILSQFLHEESLYEALARESTNEINPDITLDLGDNLRVKFHTKDIVGVLEIERRTLKRLSDLTDRFAIEHPGVLS